MASPKQRKFLQLVQEEPGVSVGVAALRLSIEGPDVQRYLTKLRKHIVVVDDCLYPVELAPTPDQANAADGYLIIDTETTGVDVERAEILEIAALRVCGDDVTEFRRYVQTTAVIPREVERLTGITAAHLAEEGVELHVALADFLAFAGDLPWVGQNLIDFDAPLLRRHLQQAGMAVPQVELFDTMYLAQAALWDDPPAAYKMDLLAATYLGGVPERAHSALVDVRTTKRFIDFCRERIRHMSADTQAVLRAFVPEVRLLAPAEEGAQDSEAALKTILARQAEIPRVWRDGAVATDLKRVLANPRPGQAEMASGILETLRGSGVHAVEAPTGTGKTRAYLAAALTDASAGPVMISTHTKQLQDQVVQEAEELASQGHRVRLVGLKGVRNYICPDRLARVARTTPTARNEHERQVSRALGLIVLHADRGEFDAIPSGPITRTTGYGRARQGCDVHPERCGSHCPFATTCAFQTMQRSAAEADVVVINHALAFARLTQPDDPDDTEVDEQPASSATSGGLPARTALRIVFDEAHDLAESAVQAFTVQISTQDLLGLADEASGESEGDGLLEWIAAAAGAAGDGALAAHARSLTKSARALRATVRRFQDVSWSLMKERGSTKWERDLSLRVTPALVQTRGWMQAANAAGDAFRALLEFKLQVSGLRAHMTTVPRYVPDVVAMVRRLSEAADALAELRIGNDPGRVYALEGSEKDVSWWSKPLFVRSVLQDVWDRFDAAVFTSATLRVAGSGHAEGHGDTAGFRHLERELALPEASYRILPPVLPYEQAHLVLSTHLPLPTHPEFSERLALELGALLPQISARTLGLFTANSRLDAVSRQLTDALPDHISTRQHGVEWGIAQLRADDVAHALGGAGLMQGLDVHGLQLVHLDKTPFPVPDLLLQAQQEALGFDRWWNEIYLPRAILRFVQAFGRLIRETERSVGSGAFVAWDRRLAFKSYVGTFLQALPSTFRQESVRPAFDRTSFYATLGEALDLDLECIDIQSAKDEALEAYRRRLCSGEPLRPLLDEAFAVLFEREGDHLRQDQFDVIDQVLQGDDVVAIMPTGSGKSLTFQLPALLQDGYTLVVSPLVALIQDQVRTLEGLRLPAAGLWGGKPKTEQQAAIDAARDGRIKMLYVAPERIRRSPELRAMIQAAPPRRVVLDEAHCLSQWGFDFRPDYLKVAKELADLGVRAPISALTATATPEDREAIERELGLDRPYRILRSFERPNLFFSVEGPLSRKRRDQRLVSLIKNLKESFGQEEYRLLVYAGTRKQTERLAALLSAYFGEPVPAYHGGLSAFVRGEVLEAFLERDVRLIVATNAFGMGVDVPDIRAVIHYDPPMSIEAYVQEAGRAGRDGRPAFAIALWGNDSLRLAKFLVDRSYPEAKDALKLLNVASSLRFPTSSALAEESGVEPGSIATLLHLLEEAGNLTYAYRPGLARLHAFPWSRRPLDPWIEELLEREELVNFAEHFGDDVEELVNRLFELADARQVGVTMLEPVVDVQVHSLDLTNYGRVVEGLRKIKLRKAEDTQLWLKTKACRREAIAHYFSDPVPQCERCDTCSPQPLALHSDDDGDDVGLDEVWNLPKEILSIVAELERRKSPRGRNRIVKVLCGQEFSHREEGKPVMLSPFLQGLPNFGRLQFVSRDRVERALDEQLHAGMLRIDRIEDKFDVIVLTDEGKRKTRAWKPA